MRYARVLLLGLVVGALAVVQSSDSATAATYDPSADFNWCNGLASDFPSTDGYTDPDLAGGGPCTDKSAPTDSAEDVTVDLIVSGGDSYPGSPVFTMTDSSSFVAADADIPDGTKVGGFVSTMTLGILNSPCFTAVPVEFILYESETDINDTVNRLPGGTLDPFRPLVTDYDRWVGGDNGSITNGDYGFVDGYEFRAGRIDIDRDEEPRYIADPADTDDDCFGCIRGYDVEDGYLDMDGDTVAGETNGDDDGTLPGVTTMDVVNGQIDGRGDWKANVDSPFVDKNPNFYVSLFDPDLDFVGGPDGPLEPDVLARYTGVTKGAGAWLILSVFQFAPGALAPFAADPNNAPHPFGYVGTTGSYISLSILNDPTMATLDPSTITDFCTPLSEKVMLLGETPDGCTDPGDVPDGGPDPCTRGKTPSSPGINEVSHYSLGQRDADGDGLENSIDTCPFNAATGNDLDQDNIGDECDTLDNTMGQTCAVDGTSWWNQDCDDYENRQDICPQAASVDKKEKDSELENTYVNAAPDGGPKGDAIGDNCDPNPTTATTEGGFVDDWNTTQISVGDIDGDGIPDSSDNCPSTPNPGQENADGDAWGDACDTEGPSPNSDGLGGSDDCIDGVDNDGDGLTDGADPTCDADGDAVSDIVDNCPDTPNPGQENADGDAWGNACDNCAATYTPWLVPVGDSDCDGFTDAAEGDIGTDPSDRCADTPDPNDEADDKWPPDFDDNQTVNIVDVLAFKPVFRTDVPPTSPRYDLFPDGEINIVDVLSLRPFFRETCTP